MLVVSSVSKSMITKVGLAPHHCTEAVFQSIVHCCYMYDLLIQSGCTRCHRKTCKSVLANYHTALIFLGQGRSAEDSDLLFHLLFHK